MIIKFRGNKLELEFNEYFNGRTAISLIDAVSKEPYMTATTNMPHIFIKDNEIIIKDYSENEGIHKALVEQDIVGPKLYPARSGYIQATVCKLLINPEKL